MNLGSAVAASIDPSDGRADRSGRRAPRTFSYADIQQRSDACARGLLRQGLRRGDRVAILAANRAEYLIAFLGAMRAGLVSVPVNYRLPAETVNFIIEDADVRLVLCDAPRAALLHRDVPRIVIDDAFESLLGCWRFHRGERGARRAGTVPVHLGLDRTAEGRRAVASEPSLGAGHAGDAGTAARPARPGRRAAVSHECAVDVPGGAEQRRHDRAAAIVHRRHASSMPCRAIRCMR